MQGRQFKERLDDPAKQWKISDADYEERQYWDDYQAAFEDALSECSTTHAPWFVIPANQSCWVDRGEDAAPTVQGYQHRRMGCCAV